MSTQVPTGADRHVALVGLSGSGKSTVAPILATRLGAGPAVDLDRMIEARLGRPASAVLVDEGEAEFRRVESELLADALAGPACVIATGGGAVLDPANRRALRERATTVWLRGTPDRLAERLADTTEARPLLAGDTRFALDRLDQERRALYQEVSDVVVDVDGATPEELVEEIERLLGSGGHLGPATGAK